MIPDFISSEYYIMCLRIVMTVLVVNFFGAYHFEMLNRKAWICEKKYVSNLMRKL